MQQPNIIEYWAEKAAAEAHQRGVRESTRKHILEALSLRLHFDTAHTFKPALEAIDDLQRLEQLYRAAILSESAEDFQKALESNGD